MIPHYGKREPGGLTASSPGDTLYFAFGSYNDSGDSEALTGLAVTDIEVFKNGNATTRATDSGYSLISDTGQIGDRVGLYRFSLQLFNTADDTGHYESGAWYQVAVDSVTIDGRTVRMWIGSFEIGRQYVDVRAISGDTGAAGWLKNTFTTGFTDTGLNQRLAQIQSDVDTGIRTHINDLDTGLHDTLADYDTGVRAILQTTGVNVTRVDGDTGAADQIGKAFATTPTYFQQVDAQRIDGDTGAAAHLQQAADTKANLLVDVREINTSAAAAVSLGLTFTNGFNDTGINQRFAQIQSDVDTGLRAQISDVDTGLHDALADYDTGVRAILQTTGVNVTRINGDTGAASQLGQAFATTPTIFQQIDVRRIGGDTGASNYLRATFANGFNDTGINDHLGRIRADVDTGLRAQISDLDTGLHDAIDAVDTGLHSVIAIQDTGFTVNAVWNALRADHVGVGSFGQYVFGDVQLIDGDTGAAAHLQQSADTKANLLVDVREINTSSSAAVNLATTFANGFNDTGINDHLGRIRADVDTGLRDTIADLDTGLRDYIDNTDTGLRALIDDLDTGIKSRFDNLAEDTGGVNITAIAGDTGAASRLQQFAGGKLSAEGAVDTGTLAGTQPGTVDANITYVNQTPVQGTGSPGDEWRP